MTAEADLAGRGDVNSPLSDDAAEQIIADAAGWIRPAGKRVLVIIPDHTRTCPLGMLSRAIYEHIGRPADRLDFLVALGTHPPLSDERIDRLLGVEPGRRGEVFPGSHVFNHRWDDPAALRKVGTLPDVRINEITGGLFAVDVEVTVNKMIFDYDVVLVVGPVFPHEVVGFSGGSKYFFPGVSGPEVLNFFHWLGAVITNPKIIGHKHTPVRATIEAAAGMLDVEKYALTMVVRGEELAGLYFGDVAEAWSAAANLSAKVHIVYKSRPFDSVLSCAPRMYDDLWVGGKCMYKLEPVVADGGELIIYAPHIREISPTHGRIIERVGYHSRDYFLAQWERFKDYPWGVLAHSTHVRGIGTYENGVERLRVNVTLATGIPRRLCEKINLGYRDPNSINPDDWRDKEDQGMLYVHKAGETLYRLTDPPDWQKV